MVCADFASTAQSLMNIGSLDSLGCGPRFDFGEKRDRSEVPTNLFIVRSRKNQIAKAIC
jgi:hypothetical protein